MQTDLPIADLPLPELALPRPAGAGGGHRPLRSIYRRDISYWPAIIPTIILRDIDRRFRHSNIAGLMLILEPMGMISVIALIQYVARGGLVIYGPSMALFLVTGFLPFYLFVHASRDLGKDVTGEREYPIVNDMDLQLARLLIEVFRNIFLTAILLTAIYFFDTTVAYPHDLGTVTEGLSVLIVMALGLGLLTSAIITVFPAYVFANGMVSRIFFFGSGVFSIPDHAPAMIKDIVTWNPLCHCLMWIRTGFYPDFPHALLDRAYVLEVAFGLLFVGLTAFAARPQPVS